MRRRAGALRGRGGSRCCGRRRCPGRRRGSLRRSHRRRCRRRWSSGGSAGRPGIYGGKAGARGQRAGGGVGSARAGPMGPRRMGPRRMGQGGDEYGQSDDDGGRHAQPGCPGPPLLFRLFGLSRTTGPSASGPSGTSSRRLVSSLSRTSADSGLAVVPVPAASSASSSRARRSGGNGRGRSDAGQELFGVLVHIVAFRHLDLPVPGAGPRGPFAVGTGPAPGYG